MFKNALTGTSVAFLLALSAARGQTPPAFEVASIKPAGSLDPGKIAAGKMRIGMKIDKARVDIGSMSLADLIRTAYRVKPYQISGPEWINVERFDIQATLPEGASPDQVPEMLQALLADRFKLALHRDTKEHAVYALTVGKGGSKLKESEPDPASATEPVGTPIEADGKKLTVSGDPNKGMVVSGGPNGTMRISMAPGGIIHMESSHMTIEALADALSRFLDRPVVDMTDLKGAYQVALDLSMEDLKNMAAKAGVAMPGPAGGADAGKSPADSASEPTGLSIFATVQQMGLKLESRKAPVALLVVDHAEKVPTEN